MLDDSEKTPLVSRESKSMGSYERATLRVNRPVYQTEELNEITTYEYPHTDIPAALKKNCCSLGPKQFLYNTIPILKWLPEYQFKKNIVGDVFSGVTVAAMHIPHGLAYGILGNLPPIVGIYMGFFPVLIYFIFGTSRHVSMGTFAIVCLMTGKTVSQLSTDEGAVNGTITEPYYSPLNVAATVTFTVSIIQFLMYLFRLGIITTLLSETLVSSFTCASAFHVVVSQFKDLLGLSLPRRNGSFRLVFTIYDVCKSLPEANIPTVIISLIFVVIISVNNEVLKPILAKRSKVPFPIELTAIMIGTTISYAIDLKGNYGVNVIGFVPTGLPNPDWPSFSLIPSVVLDSFVITMVSYTVSMSLALIVAQKNHYEVNANQELLAMSFSNCFGSMFSCMPITASLSRTMIQDAVGGVTQIASLVSCSILLVVLLWLGPLVENLPRCVLASIIIVALKSMMLQMLSLKKYWKLCKWDGLIWIATFLVTTIVGIDYGLLTGIALALTSIFIRGQSCYACLLGVIPNTDLYMDTRLYRGAQELPGIKIFHYSGALNFVSRSNFKSHLFEKTGFDPVCQHTKEDSQTKSTTHCVILDFTSLIYVDPSGVETLKSLLDAYHSVDVSMYICGCSGSVFETFKKCQRYDGKENKFLIFPTIHDAVMYSQCDGASKTK